MWDPKSDKRDKYLDIQNKEAIHPTTVKSHYTDGKKVKFAFNPMDDQWQWFDQMHDQTDKDVEKWQSEWWSKKWKKSIVNYFKSYSPSYKELAIRDEYKKLVTYISNYNNVV